MPHPPRPHAGHRAAPDVLERDTMRIALDAIRQAIMECALGGTPEAAVVTIARIVQNTDNVLMLHRTRVLEEDTP